MINIYMVGRVSARTIALILVEHLLIVAAVGVGTVLRLGLDGNISPGWLVPLWWRSSLIAGVLQICLHYCDLYDLRTLTDRRELTVGLIQALGAASLILAFLYYWAPSLIVGRGVFTVSSAFIFVLVVGWRLLFEWLSVRVGPAERLLIVGTGTAAVTLARELFDRRQELGVELVGFVDPDPARIGAPVLNPGVIGAIADIPRLVRERKIDRVVVSLSDARGQLPMNDLLHMKLNDGVRFDHLASLYEEYTGRIALENLRPSWMIFSEGFRRNRLTAAGKRAMDIFAASLGMVLVLPFIAAAAVAIRLTSPGPIFYRQRRVGKEGKVFTIVKLRSMWQDAEARTGAVWATAGDARVTPVGRVLRRTRLDEVPQLWNVLKGDMSFVGPRPERPEFVSSLSEQIPFYGQRHVVRPGVTGWAQIRHDYTSDVDGTMEKLQYDLFYIKNMSMAFDIFVLIETIKTVLVRRGS
jgi:sugar transferase (PEP-CTERM system associated)